MQADNTNQTEELKPQAQEPEVIVAPKKSMAKYIHVHGRRKEAVARVRLFNGKGEIIINGKPAGEYFPGEISKIRLQKPFVLTKSEHAYHSTIKVIGSGKNSQLDAVIHGVSRALVAAKVEFRPILKKAGLLTRDPRVKERHKYGLAQKARKGKQSPKR